MEVENKELLALRYLQRQKENLATVKSALSSSEKENKELREELERLKKPPRKKLRPKKLPLLRAREPSYWD